MIERMLDRLAGFATSRPRAVLIGCALMSLIGVPAFLVPVDFSFAGLMNREHPEVARYFAASERYGLGGVLLVVVEGPAENLDEGVLDIQLALDDLEQVRSVQTAPPRDWLFAHSAWLVEPDLFEEWMGLAEGPADPERSRALVRALEADAGRRAPPTPENARLLTIVMARDSFELALDATDFPLIRRVVRETIAPLGLSARFAGMPAIVTQEQEATLVRMRVLGPLSLLLVIAVLLTVERRPLVLLSIAAPMLLSVAVTLGLIAMLTGRLTLMESIFGVLVFGLGVDYAIHLLLRLREERSQGRDFDASLHRAILGTGRSILAGAATTAGAFAILTFAPDPVFFRLGLSGSIGLLLCLVFLMLMLPALWAMIEKRSPVPDSVPRSPLRSAFRSIAASCARRPGTTLAIGGALLVAAGLEARSLHYETNLERVFSRDIEAVETARRIRDLFGVDPGPWLVATPDLGEARRITDAFVAAPLFARAESLAVVLRDDRDARRERLDALAPDLARRVRERELAAMQLTGPAAEEARDALAPLSLLLAGQALGPPTSENLPAAIGERLIGPAGELLVYAFPAEPALDSAVAARERAVAQAIDPGATSMSAIYEALIGTDRPWMPVMLAGVVAFIAGVIALDLRSVRLTGLALLPVAASMVATLGLLAAFGFSFNTVTLVGVPLLLGIGVDDGIHVVHRMLEQPECGIDDCVGSVARSIALTTATTCASVGLLIFTRHPGIESVAILLLVGLPLSLLATVTLLPAAASLVRLR